ncbi:hypothetical protein ACFCT7_03535 [Fulvivirgaceae bacterium LMO-SS25]
MVHRIFLFTLFLSLIFSNSLYSQNDYRSGFIVTNEYDTIEGSINYRSNLSNYQSCQFKNEQGETEYLPNQIMGFGYFNDKFFTSGILDSTFVEVLVLGEINLYKSLNKYHLKKDDEIYHLETEIKIGRINGVLAERDASKWRGILGFLVSDCLVGINEIIKNLKFQERSISEIVVKYNKCSGSPFKEIKAKKPWTLFEFGASVGLNSSDIQIINGTDGYPGISKNYNSFDLSPGILISISSPRLTENVSFNSELYYINSKYTSLKILQGSLNTSPIEYHATYIDINALSVPLSIKYSFPEKKIGLFLQGGINYVIHLNSKAQYFKEIVVGSIVNTMNEQAAFEINENQVGFWGGVGIQKSHKKLKGSLSLRYTKNSNHGQASNLKAANSQFSMNLTLIKK